MKTIPILMPQMGQSAAEGAIVKWRKKVGDDLAADDIVVEVESDKIGFEVETPSAGRLAACLKGEGEVAAVGEIIGQIEIAGEADVVASVAKPHAGAGQEQVLVAAVDNDLDRSALPDISKDWLSPYVVRMAMLNSVSLQELRSIRGSGRQGRVTKTDLLTYLAQRGTAAPSAVNPSVQEALPREADAMGKVVPMTTIRRTIADHMVQSIHTSAHVTMVHAVDMTHIVRLRERIKDRFEKKFRVKMTYTTVMIFVTSRVLRQFPNINASVYGSNLLMRKNVNIGCAVALPDESLVVPVVQDADKKSFPQIGQDLDRLINLARGKALTRADIDNGTFTISNFGAFGSIIGTPIINQPQVAILGMGAVFKAPVVIDDKVGIRDQLYLSFTFNHRVIDGAMGGRFLNAIQKATEALDEKTLDVAAL